VEVESDDGESYRLVVLHSAESVEDPGRGKGDFISLEADG